MISLDQYLFEKMLNAKQYIGHEYDYWINEWIEMNAEMWESDHAEKRILADDSAVTKKGYKNRYEYLL